MRSIAGFVINIFFLTTTKQWRIFKKTPFYLSAIKFRIKERHMLPTSLFKLRRIGKP